MTDQTQP